MVAAVLLMGAGFAAASNSLTSFFQGRWQELTGEEMSQEQLEVIDGFSQEIESSQISNEITVTIDSAMASQNEMYFLLRMEGDCLQDVLVEGENWYFEHFYFGIKNAEVAAYGSHIDWHYEEDGVYYWLWECSYDALPDDVTTLNCSLSMGALHSNYDEEDKDVVINGAWSFDFTVDVSEETTDTEATDSAQEIDASGTIESDITVTVDSAMASKNEMYFLVKVEGESFMEMLDSGAE